MKPTGWRLSCRGAGSWCFENQQSGCCSRRVNETLHTAPKKVQVEGPTLPPPKQLLHAHQRASARVPAMAEHVQAALQALLGASLDEEMAQYLAALLLEAEEAEPDDGGGADVDALTELLCGALGSCFARLDSEQQTHLVLQLVEEVRAREAADRQQQQQQEMEQAQQQQAQQDAAISSSDKDAVVAAFRRASLQCQQAPACGDTTDTATQQGASGLDASPLLPLCPAGVCRMFLHDKLQAAFGGDLQAAATWLLEQAPAQLLAQQAAWQDARDAAAAAREAEAQQQRLVKKQLVERFDLQVVPCSGGGGRSKACRAPELLPLASGKHAPPDGKVRYRDGCVVSSKGEKYIVTSTKEEWDGGSRGKVMSKGKRGKGFY